MTVRPIIFSGPMVLALLEGRKTQTRRLATSPLRKCEPGDRLYVRETFHPWTGSASRKTIAYVADGQWIDWGSGWRGKPDGNFLTRATPSIHMPRWASRLTLEVEAVRVEPLQSICPADALAEGVTNEMVHRCVREFDNPLPEDSWVGGYAWLWSSLHGRESWDSNPDVLVLSFSVIADNVDRLAA